MDELVGAGDISTTNYNCDEYMTPDVTPMVTMIVATATPTEDEYCYVNGDGVRVRNEPNTKCTILKIVEHLTKLKVLEKDNGWTKILYEPENIEGYIRDDLLTFEASIPKASEVVTINTDIEYAKIVVKKKDRKLELWDGETLVDTYNIGLGWNPTGHKQQEGDGMTPEGDYYVCIKNSSSNFYLSLGISYPNKEDAKAAYDLNRINKATYDKIVSAIDNIEQPPWNTPLGGEIMIHGCGGNRDWTAGCIAVDNEVMDRLFKVCEIGTPIKILP
jgi:murein L,D-transpeptidase YafK